MKYLVVGNGAAGTAAAQKLRRLDQTSEISILTSEGPFSYSKCLLADFLFGNDPEETLQFKDADFYRQNRIQLLSERQVVSVDFARKEVQTVSKGSEPNQSFSYDRLLIASGSIPLIPDIPGLSQAKWFSLNTLADALEIRKTARNARRAVVIGAGFVGLEVAFNLRKSGLEVTVIEKASRILPKQLDEVAAGMITQGLEAEGIKLRLNATAVAIRSKNAIQRLISINAASYQVVLEDDTFIDTDLLLLTMGSRPNLDFLQPGQLRMNKGIIVDSHLQTSAPDVYAAGDVVESLDTATGRNSLSPIWPNAVLQGEYAAANMAGIRREIQQTLGMQNTAEFREIPMVTMGMPDGDSPEYESFIDYRPAKGVYRKIILKDDRIVGMIYMGDIRQAGVIGALLKSQTPVGHLKAHFFEPNFNYGEVIQR